MGNSDTDSEVFFWFQNQNQSHSNKCPSSCFLQSSYSAFDGSSSMSNTETNTADEEDVYEEGYKVREIIKKRKLTPLQLRLLEESFEEEKRLEPDKKLWLAKKLGLHPSQVAIWYQNRRAKLKTKQLEHECDHLKTSFAKLKTDFDILFLKNVTLKNKKPKMQENHEAQSMEAEKLEKEGSSVKSENTQSSEEEERSRNQYSFPELAVLGFYYDPTLTASNLRL